MKIRLLNAGLCACALLMTLSGCSSDETLTGDNSTATQSMKINVSDGMFTSVENNGAKTRATDSGTETTFTSGDAIGIFVVKSGTLALTNAKYTYNGTSWLNSNSTTDVPYYADAKYFAYYPYQESLVSDKYDATKSTTAETFFGTLIRDWTPAADQSTQANYTTQDLMVSMATVGIPTHSCTFAMSHQMAFVEMDLPQYHYTYNKADTYRFTFDAVKPFKVADGTYRLLVNPSKTFSITGKNQYNSTDVLKTKGWKITGTTPATAKYKIYKYNGASASLTQTSRQDVYIGDANIGDYLYDDGTTGTTITADKTIVGIVFSNQISSAEYNKNYTHGYALALKDASAAGPTWGPDAGLTKVTTLAGYYNDINSGYTGTVTKGYNSSNITYPAWQAANKYNVDVSKFTNSGWYLPSIGQWWDVCANLGKVDLTGMQTGPADSHQIYTGPTATTNVNNAIKAAKGAELTTNYYWSASEYYTSIAAIVDFSSSYVGLSYGGKNWTDYYVRAVLAF